ncbi:type II secretion system protein, partial [Candidatus Saccharibacteria bacterium]|nr:type II secretion system protein [Candidatus Saccharibacteria bacterium]
WLLCEININERERMSNKNIKSKKGFTIIEVVLVLAIAGLIFLMVFIALPALQRSQRDTQRRSDMGRFISQIAQYQANNNGKVPNGAVADYTTFISSYLKAAGDDFSDPSTGSDYTVVKFTKCTSGACANTTTGDDADMGEISVYSNATCDGERPKYVQGDNRIAITLKLEGAGIYCGHN